MGDLKEEGILPRADALAAPPHAQSIHEGHRFKVLDADCAVEPDAAAKEHDDRAVAKAAARDSGCSSDATNAKVSEMLSRSSESRGGCSPTASALRCAASEVAPQVTSTRQSALT